MSFSIYDASVPPMIRMLESLSKFLDKAVHQAKEKDIPLQKLLDASLAPDMFALPRQVQIATDAAKGCAARLAGLEAPSFADTETTFPELQERIAKTIAYLKTFRPEQLAGGESRAITVKTPTRTLQFSGREFLTQYANANFFFHVTTAYGILRSRVIEIGKLDYLGGA